MTEPLCADTVEQFKSVEGHRRTLWPLNRSASRDAVRRFALGVGDDNPLWWDDPPGAAPGRPAPPTFLYTGVNFGSWPDLGGGPAGRQQPTVTLWAGDHWRWSSPLRVGEAFEAASTIEKVEVRRKDGETLSLRTHERAVFTAGDGRRLGEFLRTTVTMARSEDRVSAPPAAPVTEAQLREVAECYDAEPSRRRGGEPRAWQDVAVGDPIGPIVKGPLTVTNLVGWVIGWGAPLCPTNRMLRQWAQAYPGATIANRRTGWPEGPEGIHWDPDVFGAFGYERGFDFGPQRISWAAHLCTDWCGDDGRLVELNARLLKSNFTGDVTWFSGVVTDVVAAPDGTGRVSVRIEGRNQRGELTTLADGVIELPGRPG